MAGQEMLFVMGAYTHEVGEPIDFEYINDVNHTKRGWADTMTARATIKGRTSGDGWAVLKPKLIALENAYKQQADVPFGLLHPDGTPTRQYMDPADPNCLRGPYIKHISYPHGTDAEYVSWRDWVIVVEAIYAACESQIIHYEETVRHVGTCDAAWASQYTLMGPRSYFTWPATSMHIIQSGYSIGFDAPYLPGIWGGNWGGIPVLPVQFEHLERRVAEPIKPLHLGRAFVYHGWRWEYCFESGLFTIQTPI